MVMMLSFGAILTIAAVVFAGYGVLYWLFGGSRPMSVTPPMVAPRGGAPSWLTPVVLVGMVVFGLKAHMPFWLVVLGSVFVVVMLIKLNVLSFASERHPTGPLPPPLPREARFQNATYHPTFTPPPPSKTGFGVAAGIATVILVVGLAVVGVSVAREERVRSPRNLQMVVRGEWNDAMEEARADFHEGMHELHEGMHEVKQGMTVAAQEIAAAAKEAARAVQVPPVPAAAPPQQKIIVSSSSSTITPTPPSAPPEMLKGQQKIIVSSAIPPTEPDRINRVLGRNGVTTIENTGKAKKNPKPKTKPLPTPPAKPASPELREPAIGVPYFTPAAELAEWGTEKSPNGVYIVLTDPKDQQDDYQAAFERAQVLLKNHLFAKHPEAERDPNGLNLPSFAWCEANGLIHKRVEPLDNVRVYALGTNFSPKAMDLAYNYHLGCERTRDAAKGYFGGLLVLGGLGLLLRIGTGVRPTAPVPKV